MDMVECVLNVNNTRNRTWTTLIDPDKLAVKLIKPDPHVAQTRSVKLELQVGGEKFAFIVIHRYFCPTRKAVTKVSLLPFNLHQVELNLITKLSAPGSEWSEVTNH
jgi:hypothetical protein